MGCTQSICDFIKHHVYDMTGVIDLSLSVCLCVPLSVSHAHG